MAGIVLFSSWTTGRKILLILFFCYFILYIFPFPLNLLPFGVGDQISVMTQDFWDHIALWFAKKIIALTDLQSWRKGSGDRTVDYLLVPVRLAISIFIALIWFLVDLKRKNYNELFKYLWLYLRYFLAFTLLTYGLSKVFPNQFWEPSLYDLIKPFGDSSPMGLLWKFMGYSTTYTIFTGFCEVIAGLLLLYKPTVRLGSLISLAIVTNIFLLNMSYDVPVKLFSFHLLLITTIILLPDLKNLFRIFILNRPPTITTYNPYFKKNKWNILSQVFKFLIIIFFLFTYSMKQIEIKNNRNLETDTTELYGIYHVGRFILNNDTLPPLTNNSNRWKDFIVEKNNGLIIKMDGQKQYSNLKMDTIRKTMVLKPYADTTAVYSLQYRKKDSTLQLFGKFKGDSIHIDLFNQGNGDFYLLKRKFNWINEFPMNR